jgi:hypothetical protein
MKLRILILSVAAGGIALALCSGCSTTTTSSVSGTIVMPAVNIDAPAIVVLGEESTATAEVSVAAGSVADLGSLSWGLNGTTTTCDLSGLDSTTGRVSLAIPATLAAGTYTITANTSAAAGAAYCYLAASDSDSVRVVDTVTLVANAVDVAGPTIQAALKISVKETLASHPDWADGFTLASTALAATVSATDPTAASFALALEKAGVDSDIAEDIGTVLQGAYASAAAAYKSATGRTLTVTQLYGDSKYAASITKLLTYVSRGIAEGITAYKATLATSTAN